MPGKNASGARGLGRKGSRASVACLNCRQRKIKCDVQTKETGTSCTQCHNTRGDCVLEPTGDKRKSRVNNTSEHISVLHERMQALEDMLLKERALNARGAKTTEVQISPKDKNASTTGLSPDQPQQYGAMPAESIQTVNEPHSDENGPSVPEPHHTDASPMSFSVRSTFHAEGPQQNQTSQSSGFAKYNEKQPDMFDLRPQNMRDLTGITNSQEVQSHHYTDISPLQVDINLGQRDVNMSDLTVPQGYMPPLHPSGVVEGLITPVTETTEPEEGRFYGPTSQQYLQSVHEESPSSLTDDLECDISLSIKSVPVRKLLFQNYWETHSLSAEVIVDKQRFLSDQAIGKRSQYYSTFLENALLACSTRTSTSGSIRELGEKFSDQAKSDIVSELAHLNMASLQGFLLLSDFEATRGRDRLGWMYCGIACRSLFDLGLHQNPTTPGTGHALNASEYANRHMLFLTTFVYDQLWSLYLGRPTSISIKYLHAACSTAKEIHVPDELSAWVSLCTRIAKVSDALNTTAWADIKAYDRVLAEIAADLDSCFEHVPPRLRYREGAAHDLDASAYGLNVQLFGIRIVLHRLWTRLRQDRRTEFEGHETQIAEAASPDQWTQTRSSWVIHHSAIQIAKIMRTYKRIFGVEKTITIMLDNCYVAATALISHLTSPMAILPTADNKDWQWLRSLAETLEEVQKYYPITTVMIATLSRLVEGTTLSGTFQTRRGSVAINESASSMMPPIFEGGWGSRDAFMHDFTFDIGAVNPSYGFGDDQFSNSALIAPSWGM